MPKKLSYTDNVERNMFLRSYLWEIRPEEGIMTIYKILMWINKKSNIDVKFEEDFTKFLYSLVVVLALFVIFTFLIKYYSYILFKPMFMMVICQILYFISIGGFIWNELNNAKWAGVDKDGGVSYIYPNSRGQYISEGLFMASSSKDISLKNSMSCWILVDRFYETHRIGAWEHSISIILFCFVIFRISIYQRS